MMPRIRTVKPEFFKHEDLYDAEQMSGLPCRVAFAALWCQADREGRFKWRPRTLKTDCLPFDDVDFSRVLDALETRGFIIQYEVDGEVYGLIPSFTEHQSINNKERASQLPPPPETNEGQEVATRRERVGDACPEVLSLSQGEGKGREGKGTGREGKGNTLRRVNASGGGSGYTSAFEAFWGNYPGAGRKNKRTAADAYAKALKRGADASMLEAKAAEYAVSRRVRSGTCQHAATWLNGDAWEDDPAVWDTVVGESGPRTMRPGNENVLQRHLERMGDSDE